MESCVRQNRKWKFKSFNNNYAILVSGFDKVGGGGTRWRSWLRHCAISRKVEGSIPDGVIDIILSVALWPLG
jgi:hypothetical protein